LEVRFDMVAHAWQEAGAPIYLPFDSHSVVMSGLLT
jgi:hypothetical protein